MLESYKAKWVEELHVVLWAYRATPHNATKETPYSLAYGTEAIVPLEIRLPSLGVQTYQSQANQKAIFEIVTFLEDKREMTTVQAIMYQ